MWCSRLRRVLYEALDASFGPHPREHRHVESPEAVAVLVDSKWNESVLQYLDARQEESNQMHHMLPPYLDAGCQDGELGA
jgi:hypothetical protein